MLGFVLKSFMNFNNLFFYAQTSFLKPSNAQYTTLKALDSTNEANKWLQTANTILNMKIMPFALLCTTVKSRMIILLQYQRRVFFAGITGIYATFFFYFLTHIIKLLLNIYKDLQNFEIKIKQLSYLESFSLTIKRQLN